MSAGEDRAAADAGAGGLAGTFRVRAQPGPQEAARHLRRVWVLKRVLAGGAIAILAGVLIASLLGRSGPKVALDMSGIEAGGGEIAMLAPRITGVDEAGRPYTVTAVRAAQSTDAPDIVTLEGIEADLTLQDAWLNLRAGTGALDQKAKRLSLADGIEVFSDLGYGLTAPAAAVDLALGEISGSAGVEGQGPMGRFAAQTFRITRDPRRLSLSGNVRMTIHGSKDGS